MYAIRSYYGNRIPMEVKEGDRILFSKYAGTEIKIDGVEHIFMKEDDILAVIVITSYSIHYTKLYELDQFPCRPAS